MLRKREGGEAQAKKSKHYVISTSVMVRKFLLYKTKSSPTWVREASAKGTLVFCGCF